MRVQLTDRALDDLKDIALWISQEAPDRAKTFVGELRKRCTGLSTQPRRFPIARTLNGREYRKCTHRHYLIFYVILNDHIEVVHVVHGSRDWAEELEQLT